MSQLRSVSEIWCTDTKQRHLRHLRLTCAMPVITKLLGVYCNVSRRGLICQSSIGGDFARAMQSCSSACRIQCALHQGVRKLGARSVSETTMAFARNSSFCCSLEKTYEFGCEPQTGVGRSCGSANPCIAPDNTGMGPNGRAVLGPMLPGMCSAAPGSATGLQLMFIFAEGGVPHGVVEARGNSAVHLGNGRCGWLPAGGGGTRRTRPRSS